MSTLWAYPSRQQISDPGSERCQRVLRDPVVSHTWVTVIMWPRRGHYGERKLGQATTGATANMH